ncbi:MAG: HD-GYP domain-containing protein [Clostridia bacterium]|nr:HD-GYP domain-containing protein [Clostridia bacterium]
MDFFGSGKELIFLNEVIRELSSSYHFDDNINALLINAATATISEAGCLLTVNNNYKKGRITVFEVSATYGGINHRCLDFLAKESFFIQSFLENPVSRIVDGVEKHFLPLKLMDPLLRSMLVVPIVLDKRVLGLLILLHRHQGREEHLPQFTERDSQLMGILAHQAALMIENNYLKMENQRRSLYLKTITALSQAIEAKDIYTRGHSERVAALATGLGAELKLSPDEIANINYGALLHDVGKIGISEAILNKEGRLDPEEYEIMKKHPEIGANILSEVDFLEDALDVVTHHHERIDGSGYPKALVQKEIPLAARIVGIADAWDAMTSDRAYRQAMPENMAVNQLRRGAGTQFDAYLVERFLWMVLS